MIFRKQVLALLLVSALGFCCALDVKAGPTSENVEVPYGDNSEVGQFIEVNGMRLYCEVYGTGPPVLVIHGNGGSIEAMRYQIEYFCKRYRVVVADSRGHGKSGLGTGRLTYEQMAEDLNVLLDRLKLQSVHVLGWSDGGILGLLLAMKHPDKVSRLALMGASLRPDGAYDWAPEGVKRDLSHVESMILQGDTSKPWQAIRQQMLLCIEQPNIPTFNLKAVKAPTLVMAGDRDIIRDTHTLEIFHALPNAQLCIFPGATHGIPRENPAVFNRTVHSFLSNPFRCPDSRDGFLEPLSLIPQ